MPTSILLAALTACAPPAPDSGGGDASSRCETPAPTVEPLDLLAGHRTVEAPVPADWLTETRSVPVHLWYPTEATEGTPASYIELFSDPRSLEDAPFADPGLPCKLPLVVYSHGSQAWAGNNSPLLRQLVAQGWVAAAPDHVGNTLVDNWDPRPISYSMTRVADIRATLDAIEALPDDDPLHDRVDTSRVVVAGHSFGGQTAWLLAGPTFDTATVEARCDSDVLGCSEAERQAFSTSPGDARVVAVMPLDGFADTDLVAPSGWETASVPILFLSKAEDGDSHPIETAAAADLTWARFEGACHETFTNSPVQCSTFDKQEGQELTAAFLTALAATTVLGLEGSPYAGILDGSTSLDARITVQSTR